MDDGRFDSLVRVLGSDAPRRRVLAGLLAGVPLAFGGSAVAKKKKKKCKGKRCGGRCIAKTACCTDDDCASGQTCVNDACTCTPQCAGKECGPSGCPGINCGTCTAPETCTPQGECTCVPSCAGKECGSDGCTSTCGSCDQGKTCDAQGLCCTPNCTGKVCGNDGCGGSCGTCQNGTCSGGGQCLCPFPVVRTPACSPGSCPSCSPGVCCLTDQTCLNTACAACPDAPDPCNQQQEHFCGRTSAPSPFCFCVTSVDDDTTCSSVFVNQSQATDCDSDDDCAGLLGFGVDTVCVNAPCLGLSVDKVCMNKGCVNLNAQRSETRADKSAPPLEQRSFRKGG